MSSSWMRDIVRNSMLQDGHMWGVGTVEEGSHDTSMFGAADSDDKQ